MATSSPVIRALHAARERHDESGFYRAAADLLAAVEVDSLRQYEAAAERLASYPEAGTKTREAIREKRLAIPAAIMRQARHEARAKKLGLDRVKWYWPRSWGK